MRTTIGLFLLTLFSCCAAIAAAQPQTNRRFLNQATDIQGYPCAKGYAWFYTDGHLYRCFVLREIPFGEAIIPSGSEIALTPEVRPILFR